jgi:hypothetical protein
MCVFVLTSEAASLGLHAMACLAVDPDHRLTSAQLAQMMGELGSQKWGSTT